LAPAPLLFASKPEVLGPVLGIVQRVIAAWLADRAGVRRNVARTGAVTLIQRFGSALNLNVHLHMLWLDGVYEPRADRKARLHRACAPTSAQLTGLADTIARRVLRHLAKRGWLEGDAESAFLSERARRDDGLDALWMSSITYRIATGKRAGQKVATLQTLPGETGPGDGDAGKAGGFSLHAGVAAQGARTREAGETVPLHHAPRRSASGGCRSRRKARCVTSSRRRGRTARRMWSSKPVEFIAKLAALVPPPRAHLTRFHGIFAPNANLRGQLTAAHRGKGGAATSGPSPDDRTPDEKRRAMSWAQRLKRVFGMDVTACVHCGGAVKIVASVEDPAGHPRDPRPLRQARRAGTGALPARSARAAGGGVTHRRRRRREKPRGPLNADNTPQGPALGPPPANRAKRRDEPPEAGRKRRQRRPAPVLPGTLRHPRLPRRLGEKGG
jgi:hypothetical protein